MIINMKQAVLLLTLGTVLCLPAGAAGSSAHPFRAGAAISDITPPLGGPIVGNFVQYPATNIHDQLHARCLVLDDGKTKLALVVCELLHTGYYVSQEARRLIKESTGIRPENVLISSVHTHSGCSGEGSETLKGYPLVVAQRIAEGVKAAAENLRPAEFAFATAQAPEHVNNRRWIMKPGTAPRNPFGQIDQVKMNPSPGSTNLVEPAGPTDPRVSILAFREPGGRPIAVYSAYSLHYVGGVPNGDISADYYGVYCEELKRLLQAGKQDPPFVAMMANGTSGDINNINFRQPQPQQPFYAKMQYVAGDIARKVQAALAKADYRSDITLASRYRELQLGRRGPTAEQIAWANQTLAHSPEKSANVDLSVIYAKRVLGISKTPETVSAPAQLLRVGPVCIGSMPVEIFCEIGLDFRKRCPIQPAFLVSHAHASLGYMPTPRHFALGGYETWLGTNRLEPQASEKLFAALVDMAAEVKN